MGPVDLVESPEQILCGTIHVVAARVVGEVVGERRLAQLLPKQIDLVEEKDDRCSHKPSRVDD